MTQRSGDIDCNANIKVSSLALIGESTGMDISSAVVWTGLEVSFLFLPEGAGGCVTTATTSKILSGCEAAFCRIRKTSAATSGVPEGLIMSYLISVLLESELEDHEEVQLFLGGEGKHGHTIMQASFDCKC